MMENKRIAFIGRSSSGKTTLITEFANQGYQTVPEMAREVLTERNGYEVTDEENLIRQKVIYSRQKGLEDTLCGLSFHDRGLIDVVGYANYFNVDSSFIEVDLKKRYDVVFEMEKRPFIPDSIRIEENAKEADDIFRCVKDSYLEFGYSPVFLSNFCEERVENAGHRLNFVLNYLNEEK